MLPLVGPKRGCLIKRQPLNTKPDSCEESGFVFRGETKQNASRLYSIRDWISSELAHGYRNYCRFVNDVLQIREGL